MDSEPEKEAKLVDLVSTYKIIFDKRVDGYRSRTQRQRAWEEISVQMEMPAGDCQKFWNNLRSQYMAHRRKLRTPSGSAAANRPFFRHEQSMQFISDAMGEERTYSNLACVGANGNENANDLGQDGNEIEPEGNNNVIAASEPTNQDESQTLEQPSTSANQSKPRDHRIHENASKKRKMASFDQELVQLLKDDATTKDEFTAIGNVVAMKLRELRKCDKKLCSDTQFKIHQVLHDAEMSLE